MKLSELQVSLWKGFLKQIYLIDVGEFWLFHPELALEIFVFKELPNLS